MKMTNKLLTMLLCVALVAGVVLQVPINGNAAEPDDITDPVFFEYGNYADLEIPEILEISGEEADHLARCEEQRRKNSISEDASSDGICAMLSGENSLSGTGSDYYYNYLSEDEKALYDQLVKRLEEFYLDDEEPTRSGDWYFCVSATFDPDLIPKEKATQIANLIYLSEPKYFFIKTWGVSITSSSNGTKTGRLLFYAPYEFRSRKAINEYRDVIEEKTEEWMNEINSFSEPLEKEKRIIELISDNTEYGKTDRIYEDGTKKKTDNGEFEKTHNHQTIAGGLVDGVFVCAGYARLTAYLCNLAGIDCIYIRSQINPQNNIGHAYNYVKLYDKWYCQDTCWMDVYADGKQKNAGTGSSSDYLDWNGSNHNKSQVTFKTVNKEENVYHVPSDDYQKYDIILPYPDRDVVTDDSRRVTVKYDNAYGPQMDPAIYIWGDGLRLPDYDPSGGYRFGGWYSDSSYTRKIDEGTYLYSDMTLYGLWETVNADDKYLDIRKGELRGYSGLGGTVTIPSDVSKIDTYGFLYTSRKFSKKITEFRVSAQNPQYKDRDGVIYSKDGASLIAYPSSKKEAEYEVPAGVARIGRYSVISNSGIQKIILPDGLKTIDDYALFDNGLQTISFPDSVDYIGVWSLCYNDKLTGEVRLPEMIRTLNTGAFSRCKNITDVYIPVGISTIGDRVFEGCTSLKNVYYNGTGSQWDKVKKGEDWIPETAVLRFADEATYKVRYMNCSLPDGFVKEGSKLLKPTDPSKEGYVFGGWFTDEACTGAYDFDTPVTADLILYARWESAKPEDFIIENGKITGYSGNGGEVVIPTEVTDIDLYALGQVRGITAYRVAEGNKTYTAVDGVLFSADKKTLVAYPRYSPATSYSIPDGTKNIGSYAFIYNSKLTDLTIPDSVSSIGNYAFFNSKSFKNINFGRSVRSIGREAFACIYSLEGEISLPSEIGYLGKGMFRKSEGITSVTADCKVTVICEDTFKDCTGLKEVTLSDDLFAIETDSFAGCDNLEKIIFKGSEEAWNDISKSEARIPSGIKLVCESGSGSKSMNRIKSVTVKAPDKKNYRVGETIDLTGSSITIYYDEGAISTINVTEDMVSGFDTSAVGTKTVVITYLDYKTNYTIIVSSDRISDPDDGSIKIGSGGEYATLSEAIDMVNSSIKKGNALEKYTFDVGESHTENKALKFPNGNTVVTITGSELILRSPAVTAGCDLILDVKLKSASAKGVNLKVASGKTVTFNKQQELAALTGTKTSGLLLEADVYADNVRSFKNIDTMDSILKVGKSASAIGTIDGTLIPGISASVNEIGDAVIYETAANSRKINIGGIKTGLNVIVGDGSAIDSGARLFNYTGKTFDSGKVTVGNRDKAGNVLNAYRYNKSIIAEYGSALSVYKLTDGEWEKMGYYPGFDAAFADMRGKDSEYMVYVMQDMSLTRILLPKNIGKLTIRGNSNDGSRKVLNCGSTNSIKASSALVLLDVSLVCSTGYVNVKGSSENLILNNAEIGNVNTSGWLGINNSVIVHGLVKAGGVFSGTKDGGTISFRKMNVGRGGIWESSRLLTLIPCDGHDDPVIYGPGDQIKEITSFAGRFDSDMITLRAGDGTVKLKCVKKKVYVD